MIEVAVVGQHEGAVELTAERRSSLALVTATSWPLVQERLVVAVTLIGFSAATLRSAGTTEWYGWHVGFPAWVGWLWMLPLTSFVVGIGVAVRYGRTGGLWAGLVLLLPISATQPSSHGYFGAWGEAIDSVAWQAIPADMAGVLLLTLLVSVTIYLSARPDTATTARDGWSRLDPPRDRPPSSRGRSGRSCFFCLSPPSLCAQPVRLGSRLRSRRPPSCLA